MPKAENPIPSTLFERPSPKTEKLQLRQAAEQLLTNPEFRQVSVTEINHIPGMKYDVTVSLGQLPSLGGWRIAPSEHLLSTLDLATVANPDYTDKLTTKDSIHESNEAKAGVVEAERLATDMALKWAIMRATMNHAKSLPGVYPDNVTADMIDGWIKASQFSGGKSVAVKESLQNPLRPRDRKLLVGHHSRHIALFNDNMGEENHHITAPDMGTTSADMTALSFLTHDVASMAPEYGGSGDPSPVTALGVYHGVNATLDFLEKDGNATTFAIQGATGEVGSSLVRHLRERYKDAAIVIADLPEKSEATKKLAEECNATIIDGDGIFEQQGSIFIPSGPSAQLNDSHLEKMQTAKIVAVVGPANYLYPPYQEEAMSQKYHTAGILVAPAPLVNQGGIRNIALGEFVPEEQRPSKELINASIADVGPMLTQIFKQATEEGKTPEEVFREIALDEFAALCVAKGIINPALLNKTS
jgi:hypothetical protein